jgi:hypothetical protein
VVETNALALAADIPVAVCVSCRTAMATVGRCDCGESCVVDLRQADGRALLRRAVWGSDEHQQRLRAAGSVRGLLRSFGPLALLALLFICFSATEPAILGVLAVAVGFLGAVFGSVTYLYKRQERREALRPQGVAGRLALPPAGEGPARSGIAHGDPFQSPLGYEPCLAFEAWLRADNSQAKGADIVWRESGTAGFFVRLDDGETVRIPAGPVRLWCDFPGTPASEPAARQRLPPALGDDGDAALPCVPPAAAFEQLLRPGDRVTVLGPQEPRELREDDDSAPRESLRAPARRVLVPVGTPVLVIQRAQGEGAADQR